MDSAANVSKPVRN